MLRGLSTPSLPRVDIIGAGATEDDANTPPGADDAFGVSFISISISLAKTPCCRSQQCVSSISSSLKSAAQIQQEGQLRQTDSCRRINACVTALGAKVYQLGLH
jgi:hypothetical protein